MCAAGKAVHQIMNDENIKKNDENLYGCPAF